MVCKCLFLCFEIGLHGSVTQVADAGLRSGRLLEHESAEILQLSTQRRIRAVVDEEPELHADSIVLNWRPVGDPHSLVIHINQDVISSEVGRSTVLLPFHGHNDAYRHTRSGRLLLRACRAGNKADNQ